MKTAAILALAGAAVAVDTITYQTFFINGQSYSDGDDQVDLWKAFPALVDPTPGAYVTVAMTTSTSAVGLSCVNQAQVDNIAAAYNAQQSGFQQVCGIDTWFLDDCGTFDGYEVNINGPICGCTTGATASGAGRLRPGDSGGNWGGMFVPSCPGASQVLGLTFTAPQVIVDPVFTGFDNSEYEFKGVPFEIFNILSDIDFQLNARFVPWTHGTFMGDLGFLLGEHNVEFHANGTVLADGVDMKTNQEYSFAGASATFTGRDLHVTSESFDVHARIVADNRIDMSVSAKRPAHPHGVLGQTYGRVHQQHAAAAGDVGEGFIEGTYVDYLVKDGLLGKDFAYNRFGESKIDARRSANENAVLAIVRGI